MKEQIEKLVKSFGENSRIGDILQRWSPLWTDKGLIELLVNWRNVDLTKSLQEIVEETEWMDICPVCFEQMQKYNKINVRQPCENPDIRAYPNSSSTLALFSFLLSLNLTK